MPVVPWSCRREVFEKFPGVTPPGHLAALWPTTTGAVERVRQVRADILTVSICTENSVVSQYWSVNMPSAFTDYVGTVT